MTVRDFSKLYFAFVFFHLVMIYKPDEAILYYISKPLITMSLLLYYISRIELVRGVKKWYIALALFFSLAGNIVLMWEWESSPLPGIISFGITHLFYTLFFTGVRDKPWSLLPLLLSLIVVVAVIWMLNQYLSMPVELRIPVSIYSALLSLNFMSGIQFGFSPDTRYVIVPAGIFLILLSALLWFYNYFIFSHEYFQIAVMALYAAGQFMAVTGVLKHLRKKEVPA